MNKFRNERDIGTVEFAVVVLFVFSDKGML